MKNLKLSYKLGIGFGLLLLTMLIVAIVNKGYLTNIEQQELKIRTQFIPVIEVTEQFSSSFSKAHALFLLYTVQKHPSIFDQALKELQQAKKHLIESQQLTNKFPSLNMLAKDTQEIQTLLTSYEKGNQQLHNNYLEETQKEVEKHGNAILTLNDKISLAGIEDIKMGTEETSRTVHIMRSALNTGTVLSLVFGVVLTIFLTRLITLPLIKAKDFANTLATGDFRERLDIDQNDEAGQLAYSMNEIATKTGSMIKGISNGMDTLASSSTELSAIAEQVAAGAEQTSGKAETVSVAAEEMSANMNSVAAAVEEATTNVSLVASATDEMTNAVHEISENTSRASVITMNAVKDVQAASEKVAELGQAANEIGKVTESITDISDQTNLLALNATIEAARAGEAGKGFAVVANEIKELAKQTAEATGEIRSRIEGIQTSTQGTVAQITQISSVINEINTIVSTIATAIEEQTATTTEISTNMQQATLGLQEITENVAQSSAVSGEIAQEIVEVNHAAQEMTTAGIQVRESIQELSILSEKLRHMASSFKV